MSIATYAPCSISLASFCICWIFQKEESVEKEKGKDIAI
jgi:hypothetical protein